MRTPKMSLIRHSLASGNPDRNLGTRST